METQLKQRLTGAIILVVIAVLVVPELLTGPKEPVAAAPVANDAAPIRSYTIDLTGATPPRVTRSPALAQPAPFSGPTTPAVAALPAANAATAATAATAVAPSAVAPGSASTSAAASSAKPPAQVATVAPAATVPAAEPAVLLSSKAGSQAGAQGFAVQLGSYANRDTVARLTKSLRAAGFKVSVAQVRAGGKDLQRVRVGPVADRAAAEALQARLTAAGHKGPIVPFP